MNDEILTELEAAEFLKVERLTLAKWRRNGLPVPKHAKVAKQYRYLKSDLINFIKQQGE